MEARFMMKIRERDFVLYAGLLDAAHARGLKSIETFLHQVPCADNGDTAIVLCKAVLKRDGEEFIFSGIGDASPKNVAVAVKESLIRMAETRAKARALRDAVNIGITAFEEVDGSSARSTLRASSSLTAQRAREPGAARTAATAARSGERPRNNTGALCPSCHCPDGQQHTAKCAAVNGAPLPAAGEARAAAGAVEAGDAGSTKLHIEEGVKLASPAQVSALRSMCTKLGWDAAEFVRDQVGVGIDRLAFTQASELITELTNRKRSAAAGAR